MRTAWKCVYSENGKLWKCVIAMERVKCIKLIWWFFKLSFYFIAKICPKIYIFLNKTIEYCLPFNLSHTSLCPLKIVLYGIADHWPSIIDLISAIYPYNQIFWSVHLRVYCLDHFIYRCTRLNLNNFPRNFYHYVVIYYSILLVNFFVWNNLDFVMVSHIWFDCSLAWTY